MTELESRISQRLATIAERAQPDADLDAVLSQRASALSPEEPSRSKRWALLAAAALVIAVGVVGILAATTRTEPSDSAPIADAPVDGSDLAAVPLLFPEISADSSSTMSFATPTDAVEAYLTDRTAATAVPPGYSVTFEVGEAVALDDRTVIVNATLRTIDDRGDLRVAVTRNELNGQDQWFVTAARTTIEPIELDNVTLDNGTLAGTFAASAGGETYLSAHDRATGALLGETIVVAPVALDTPNDTPEPFTIDVGQHDNVQLRYWNVVATDGSAYQFANFGEVVVISGMSLDQTGWAAVALPTQSTVPSGEPNDPSSIEDFCTTVTEQFGNEVPEEYVGSPQHVADIETLLEISPATIAAELADFRDFLASGAVDPSTDPDSNLIENWPPSTQDAINTIELFVADNC